MAPAASVAPAMPAMAPGYMASERRSYSRQASGMQDSRILNSGGSRRESGRHSRSVSNLDTSNISSVVYALKRRSGNELGSNTSAKLLNETYDSIRDWIGAQRMSQLPAEGSSYDKVLTWTQLFVERLNSFDVAIQDFAGDSYLAAQLAYGYCAILLELGKENAPALMVSFGFFYSISMSLVNLLERTELFSVSQDIREQLVLALSDLVTLVASVATHFHKAINDSSDASVSVNMYSSFSSQIKAFNERCEKIAHSMWRHQLIMDNLDGDGVSDTQSIKSWIAPEDRVLTNVAVGLSLLAHDREELTCLWVGPYLTRFLKGQDTILSISGKPGSGKSIVASVIVDYLQRPISGAHYNALFVPINSRIPAETSSRAVAKAILCLLFERRIGNIPLLHILLEAYERCQHATKNEEYDDIVWDALHRALSAALPGARELIVVVDGIDEASCGEAALFKRLTAATADGTNVKLITLGTEKQPASKGRSNVQINEDLIFDDVIAVVRSHFDSDNEFSTMSEFEQESIITRLSEASDGSFLWAKLATKRLRREVGLDKFRHAVDDVVKTKPTITDFVARNLQSSSMTDDARLMLMWLTVAERPLSLRELATLASIQVDKSAISDKGIDVLAALRPVQNLVFLQDGLLYIRHGMIRSSLHEILNKGQLVTTVKDPHADLVARLLLYIKTNVTEQREPSISVLDAHDTSQYLNKYPLLDFAIRHWPYHLTKSWIFMKEGDVAAAKAFSKVYPISVTAFLLQGSLWQHRPKPLLLSYQTTVTNIYRQLFTTKSTLTLQSVIFLAILYHQVNLYDEAAPLMFEAVTISNKLLATSHTVTMQMASWYIEITESKVTSTKNDIMTKREEILTILVDCNKAKFGSSSTQVVTILRQLVEHYRSIKDERKVQQITESIRSITTTKSVGEPVDGDNGLHIQLRGRKELIKPTVGDTLVLVIEERDELIEGSESYDFTAALKKAELAVSEGRIEAADRAYVDIWQRASQEYRSHHSELWAERNLRAVLGYSKFLNTQKRITEASAIMTSIWEEYSQSSISATETSASLLTQVAHGMKSVGLSATALSVFKYCSRYYRATNRTQTSAYKEIQQSVQATSQEVMKSATSSETLTSETTLEEMVLESSSSSATMDEMTFKASSSLASLYISQHRWEDASQFLKKILYRTWSSLFSTSIQDVTLAKEHADTCVELAERLADCYRARRSQVREEDTRVRIYRALRSSRKVDDKVRERVTSELLAFYRRTSQNESTITTRQEMLDDYTEHYGLEHPTVIKTLWELAELTRPRPIYIEYYRKIIHAINKETEVSKPEALQPVIIVATELWSRAFFSDALPYYKTLFATFLKASKSGPNFQDQTFVREFFDRYTSCLRSVRVSFTTLHKITTEYQARCKTVYGATASVTIHATLTLAKVCQESESCEQQAIALYEELLKIKSDEIDHHEISTTLDMIYEEQSASMMLSSSSTSMTSEQINRAVTVLRKRITTVRETRGWASEQSLSTLTELVSFYSRKQETETVVRELKETTIKVLTTETSSTRLMTAASTIASNYIATNQVQKATELMEEVYRQIVMKETSNAKKSEFDVSSRGRESLVFLAQLEYSLHRSSATLAEIMAALTTQHVYFAEFRSLVESKTSVFYDVSVSTARLYYYLKTCDQQMAAAAVLDQFSRWFIDIEAKRLNLNIQSLLLQTKLFLRTILEHFRTHKSKDMVRSVGIIGNSQVAQLIKDRRYNDACDLAHICFKFIQAHKSYHTITMVKLVLTMGMGVSGRASSAKADATASKKLLEMSQTIIQDVLGVMDEMKVNIAQVDLTHLNQLIGLVGEQQDYKTMSRLLTSLWSSRETLTDWPPTVTFALARRFILARYLVGESMAALRMAEHIVYNCRRVLGLRHPATLEISILLSQLYTGIAQKYQQVSNGNKSPSGGKDMANRYYKKSAAIHENILRVYSDEEYASVDGGALMEASFSGRSAAGGSMFDGGSPESPLMIVFGDLPTNGHDKGQSDGQHVRQHMQLLKLALERLGDWPKEYAEYERLNADVFREYGNDLKGFEGVEKWNLKSFGHGKAESGEGLLRPEDYKNWELLDMGTVSVTSRVEEDEEL
ncbi:nacht domain protein [Seiridium cupressi]